MWLSYRVISSPQVSHSYTRRCLDAESDDVLCRIYSLASAVRHSRSLQWGARFSFFSVRLGLHSSVDVDAIFHLCLYGITLEMTYFRAELVQRIVSRSDLKLEVQRYGMKKNTLTVDPIMLQDELWDNVKNRPQTAEVCFENRTADTKFWVFEFWGHFGLVFRKPTSESDIFTGFCTSLFTVHLYLMWYTGRY